MNNRASGELGTSPTTADPVRLEGFGPTDLYQHREKIFTRYVGGFFQRLRFFSGWPLLVGYVGLPWLNWGDRQAVLFDLPARQFHLFGLTAWPQDLWLLGWLLMIAAFGLFTVTTIVGRLWCGYTCPQTVWTAIFMWAEQFAEGPRHQRIRLDKAPWSFEKLRKRGLKHSIWVGWAFLTGLSFVGYFVPIRELVLSLGSLQIGSWVLFWIVFFSVATYINAGWLREQVCIYMCPYARFQSAMIDKDTLVVSYDVERGEPRGSRKRNAKSASAADKSASVADKSASVADNLGHCIDCQLCVQVCPTGIDIRDGLQYECIGCAHCIDACAEVMKKMDYPPGLIRYSTEREMAGGKTHWLRARSVGYATVCNLLIIAFGYALLTRVPFSFDVLRERGDLYHVMATGEVRNEYQLRVMNKTQASQRYELRVAAPSFIRLSSVANFQIAAGEIENLPMQLLAKETTSTNVIVALELCDQKTGVCAAEETRFLAPAGRTQP